MTPSFLAPYKASAETTESDRGECGVEVMRSGCLSVLCSAMARDSTKIVNTDKPRHLRECAGFLGIPSELSKLCDSAQAGLSTQARFLVKATELSVKSHLFYTCEC